MKLLDDIKSKIGYFLLKRELKDFQRQKAFNNFESAKTAGIICNAQDSKTYEVAKKFAQFLAEKNIQVSALGFIDGDAVLDAFSYQKGFIFISKKDLNWLRLPKKGNDIDNFLSQKFDIMVNLILEESLPIDYIVNLSKAKCKIGTKNNNQFDAYDIVIDISKNNKLEFFLEQVKHYLTIIKK